MSLTYLKVDGLFARVSLATSLAGNTCSHATRRCNSSVHGGLFSSTVTRESRKYPQNTGATVSPLHDTEKCLRSTARWCSHAFEMQRERPEKYHVG